MRDGHPGTRRGLPRTPGGYCSAHRAANAPRPTTATTTGHVAAASPPAPWLSPVRRTGCFLAPIGSVHAPGGCHTCRGHRLRAGRPAPDAGRRSPHASRGRCPRAADHRRTRRSATATGRTAARPCAGQAASRHREAWPPRRDAAAMPRPSPSRQEPPAPHAGRPPPPHRADNAPQGRPAPLPPAAWLPPPRRHGRPPGTDRLGPPRREATARAPAIALTPGGACPTSSAHRPGAADHRRTHRSATAATGHMAAAPAPARPASRHRGTWSRAGRLPHMSRLSP